MAFSSYSLQSVAWNYAGRLEESLKDAQHQLDTLYSMAQSYGVLDEKGLKDAKEFASPEARMKRLQDHIRHAASPGKGAAAGLSASQLSAGSRSLSRTASPTQRDNSSRLNTSQPSLSKSKIADSLFERQKEAEARLEAKRLEREKEELASLRQAPAINPVSRNLAKRRTGGRNIADRSALELKEKEAKQMKLRKALAEKEIAELRPIPQINANSKRMQRGVNSMISWEARRQEKLEKARKEFEAREEAKCEPKRFISAGSAKLAAGLDVIPVEERLSVMGQIYEKRAESRVKAAASETSFKPKVSSRSASLKRKGSASERLYNLGKEKVARENARQAEHNRGVIETVKRGNTQSAGPRRPRSSSVEMRSVGGRRQSSGSARGRLVKEGRNSGGGGGGGGGPSQRRNSSDAGGRGRGPRSRSVERPLVSQNTRQRQGQGAGSAVIKGRGRGDEGGARAKGGSPAGARPSGDAWERWSSGESTEGPSPSFVPSRYFDGSAMSDDGGDDEDVVAAAMEAGRRLYEAEKTGQRLPSGMELLAGFRSSAAAAAGTDATIVGSKTEERSAAAPKPAWEGTSQRFGASEAAVQQRRTPSPAAEASPEDRPVWQQYLTADDRPYYYNLDTGETTWKAPASFRPATALGEAARSTVSSKARGSRQGGDGRQQQQQPKHRGKPQGAAAATANTTAAAPFTRAAIDVGGVLPTPEEEALDAWFRAQQL